MARYMKFNTDVAMQLSLMDDEALVRLKNRLASKLGYNKKYTGYTPSTSEELEPERKKQEALYSAVCDEFFCRNKADPQDLMSTLWDEASKDLMGQS